jgi:hypothetical protein
MPLETTLGMSHRKLQGFASHEKSKIIANFGLFGRPIEGGTVRVQCINRLVLSRVQYELHFGPVGYQ